MKIILCAINTSDETRNSSLGIQCLKAELTNTLPEVKAECIESTMSESSEIIFSKIKASIENQAHNNESILIGFSLFVWNSGLSYEIIQKLRKEFPNAVVFAGGPEASANAFYYMKKKYFDFIIAGEGEESLSSIAKAIKDSEQSEIVKKIEELKLPNVITKEGDLNENTIQFIRPAFVENLEKLTSPWLTNAAHLNKHDSVLWELSRGCPYKCAYCYESKGSSKTRRYPFERLEKELELFKAKGVDQITVLDPTFNANLKEAKKLVELFIEKANDIYYALEARAELFDEELVELLSELFCSVQIGLQTQSESIAKELGRSYNKKKFEQGIEYLNEYGIIFGLDLIYGLPHDTLKGFYESIDYAISMYPNHLDVFKLSVLPGTELYTKAKEYGLEYLSEAPYSIIKHPTFSEKDLENSGLIANAINLLYCEGKAVPWFNQFAWTLQKKPHAIFKLFSEKLQTYKNNLHGQELREFIKLFYRDLFTKQGKTKILNLTDTLLDLHWAFADAINPSRVVLNANTRELKNDVSLLTIQYPVTAILQAGSFDLEEFAKYVKGEICNCVVWSSPNGISAEPVSKELFTYLKNLENLSIHAESNPTLYKKAQSMMLLKQKK